LARATDGTKAHPPSPLHVNVTVPSHSRTRSISTPFSPVLPSPLASSYPSHPQSPALSPRKYAFPTLPPEPEDTVNTNGQHSRRHSRLHSRNLSIFFPRPGSLPHTPIAEDGAKDLDIADGAAPTSTIPSAGSSVSVGPSRQLGAGFTFGARPPGGSPGLAPNTPSSAGPRRGHHHKHSLSHNFFSFLEPGNQIADLHTQPTPVPVSPWTPMSAFPQSAAPSTSSFSRDSIVDEQEHHTHAQNHADTHTDNHTHDYSLKSTAHPYHNDAPSPISRIALVCAIAQFVLGSWLWVTGQQIGSLSCTGLGYWVVFDAFGVAISKVVPGYISASEESVRDRQRRPYGCVRLSVCLHEMC
jgi:hypothetical protein